MKPAAPALLEAADRFAQGGCCGKSSKVRWDDLAALGLTPVPATFDSSLGTIIPMAGWKEMCVWVYETMTSLAFPTESQTGDAGELVAAALRELASAATPKD